MKIVKLGLKEVDALALYLTSVQSDFTPPLSNRVAEQSGVSSMEDYAQKVLTKGMVFAAESNTNKIIAAIAIYVNDMTSYKAYIPILSVARDFKGKGIGSLLIEESIRCSLSFKMKEIHVKTWPANNNAINLYQKFNFIIESKSEENIQLVKYL